MPKSKVGSRPDNAVDKAIGKTGFRYTSGKSHAKNKQDLRTKRAEKDSYTKNFMNDTQQKVFK